MAHSIQFFPVGNGDMTLITLQTGQRILIDCNIRSAGSDENDDTFDALAALKENLKKDSNERYYVDAFVLSHPDTDHCRGFKEHFYVGSPSDRADDDDKIFIKEIWSSPIVFRRFTANDESLSPDAKEFLKEAKRRVKEWKGSSSVVDGDRVLILSEDQDGKTDDLEDILVKTGGTVSKIAGKHATGFSALLLGPLPPSDDEDTEEVRQKNRSSVIINFSLEMNSETTRFLTGGDAGVGVWEQINDEYDSTDLEYDILLSPHHCSWRSLSHDSWSESDDPEVSDDAKSALSNMIDSDAAVIVASSKPVKDEDSDPPCLGAKDEYVDWLGSASRFFCTDEHIVDGSIGVLKFSVTGEGLVSPTRKSVKLAKSVIGSQTIEHG